MKLTSLVSDPTKLQTHGKYISAEEAFDKLRGGTPITDMLIQVVASDPWYAYLYALNVIKGRFPEGEATIATTPYPAYYYAYDVIKDRFPEGEAAIASDPYYGFRYAHEVIKGRFFGGEAIINSDPYYRQKYAELIGNQ